MNQFQRRLRAAFGTGLAACGLILAAGGGACAQFAFDDGIMPPRVVAWRLAERGFTGIARPRFDGRAYVVEAFGPDGARLRLFVDAEDGAILGRQRLDVPPTALARPAPGYGWTEEDEGPRRPARQAGRLLPPADIPMPGDGFGPLRRQGDPRFDPGGDRRFDPGAGPLRSEGPAGAPGRAAIDPNPQGVNPDARGRSEPRRLARTGNPAKVPDGKAPDGKGSELKEGTAQGRTVPEAPKLRPVEAAKPDARSEAPVAAVEPPKPGALPGAAPTPAAVQPPAEGTTAKPVEQTWKDPPEGRRNVRVIGGPTLVPGTADKEPAAP